MSCALYPEAKSLFDAPFLNLPTENVSIPFCLMYDSTILG